MFLCSFLLTGQFAYSSISLLDPTIEIVVEISPSVCELKKRSNFSNCASIRSPSGGGKGVELNAISEKFLPEEVVILTVYPLLNDALRRTLVKPIVRVRSNGSENPIVKEANGAIQYEDDIIESVENSLKPETRLVMIDEVQALSLQNAQKIPQLTQRNSGVLFILFGIERDFVTGNSETSDTLFKSIPSIEKLNSTSVCVCCEGKATRSVHLIPDRTAKYPNLIIDCTNHVDLNNGPLVCVPMCKEHPCEEINEAKSIDRIITFLHKSWGIPETDIRTWLEKSYGNN